MKLIQVTEMTAYAGTTEYNSIDFSVNFKTKFADLDEDMIKELVVFHPTLLESLKKEIFVIKVYRVEDNES